MRGETMMRKAVFAAFALTLACQSEAAETHLPPLAVLEPDLRIGSPDARDYFLTVVSELEVNEAGTIYVMQGRQQTIKVFDSNGVFVRRIGRMGAGPGEFQSPYHMGWVGDTLWVYDGPLTRLSLFDQTGSVVGSVRYGQHGEAALLKDGTVAFRPFSLRGISATALLRLFLGTGDADTIARIGMLPNEGWNPFRDDPIWKAGPGGSYVVVVDRSTSNAVGDPAFHLTKIAYTGDTLWHKQYRYTPVPLTDDIISAFVEPPLSQQNERLQARGFAAVSVSDFVAGLYIPDVLVPVTRLVLGFDDTIWLRREDSRAAMTQWDVLDFNGDRAFSVAVPTETRILRATHDMVWARENDELDVPYVVRYRVVR
jgi:hypothetical protein